MCKFYYVHGEHGKMIACIEHNCNIGFARSADPAQNIEAIDSKFEEFGCNESAKECLLSPISSDDFDKLLGKKVPREYSKLRVVNGISGNY